VPSPSRCLTAGDAFSIVRDRAVARPSEPPKVGFELEWLTHPTDDPSCRVTPAALTAALASTRLPAGGTTSIEPGGQIELATPPSPSLTAALDAALLDAGVLRGALRDAGIETVAAPIDERPPMRVLDAARYRAMEAYFDSFGTEGRTMMCNTASLQVNVDPVGDPCTAWRAVNIAAAVLGDGRRRAVWSAIDPTRTAPVEGDDIGASWATYALDARVMFIRIDADTCVPILDGSTMRGWLSKGHRLGWPTVDDVLEHLTTLFPPVRPRGFFEVRTLDAQDDDAWPALATTVATFALDPRAAHELVQTPHPSRDDVIGIARDRQREVVS
jgi:glutamate--cysteine ligase